MFIRSKRLINSIYILGICKQNGVVNLKNSKFDLEAEYKILPDDELKRIFKKYEKKQKLLAGIPV